MAEIESFYWLQQGADLIVERSEFHLDCSAERGLGTSRLGIIPDLTRNESNPRTEKSEERWYHKFAQPSKVVLSLDLNHRAPRLKVNLW